LCLIYAKLSATTTDPRITDGTERILIKLRYESLVALVIGVAVVDVLGTAIVIVIVVRVAKAIDGIVTKSGPREEEDVALQLREKAEREKDEEGIVRKALRPVPQEVNRTVATAPQAKKVAIQRAALPASGRGNADFLNAAYKRQ